jgi:CubicO group peptidase (beta-lactamase class C family)
MIMIRLALAAIILFLFASDTHAADKSQSDWNRSIDRFTDKALERWEVPGLAVAVLRDGEVIYQRISGLRDVDRNLPVTPNTLFAVGSISKSFTVAGLAMLARAGKLDWDAPVTDYLPELILRPGPPVSTRDLITHRSGMHRHDALWYLHTHTRDELVRRLRYLPRFSSSGKDFQYSNLMVMAAGRIAGKISGGSWETLIRDKILAPLAMNNTRLGLTAFRSAPDRALGYYPGPDGRIQIRLRDTDAIGPAAAVYSNIKDMTRWLRHLMDAGHMTTARIEIDDPPSHGELGPKSYGMGLYLGSYRGNPLARHPGVIDGYGALMSFMPAQKLGIIVLTNKSGGNPAPAALSYAIYDRILGLEPKDWLGRFPSSRERRFSGQKTSTHRIIPTSPTSHPLPRYEGIYKHPAYGTMTIDMGEGSQLSGRFHALSFTLEHAGSDQWRLTETHWPLREGLAFRFITGPAGKITRLATRLADGPTYRHNPGELYFERRGDLP